ncbi:MAG: acetyl-CoA carboxylase biotin carboxylase subunit [Nocardioides sp.]|uniref:acetyl-CoA carboxylase biotin carboxylase subunit n=1 Tax=Nocardioides sp. TaxID=35761 RepID=UPI0039E7164E
MRSLNPGHGLRLRRVLVANRGEIAVRIIRACFDEGIESVAVVSEADRDSMAARLATTSVVIGPAAATKSYLSVPRIVGAAIATGCDAIHPGYGFLSERPDLAEECERQGIVFVGPPADVIRRGGDKIVARQVAAAVGIPVGEGSDLVESATQARDVADRVGLPLLLKAAAGGGGRGMVKVGRLEDIETSFATASTEAASAFGDGSLFVERYIENARHVEVQILADRHGHVIHLGERDCSVQRRYQKLVEESPSTVLTRELRQRIWDSAVALGRALDYVGAGTVEFLVDVDREEYAFLEVNTRVQVEHPVTEMVTGVDIVRAQLRVAAGAELDIEQQDVRLVGHAIECRLNAENPSDDFLPSPGLVKAWTVPAGEGIRVDTHCHDGYRVSPHYDSLIAKVICWGEDRAQAVRRIRRVLAAVKVDGVEHTGDFLSDVVASADFQLDRINTRWVEDVFLPAWRQQLGSDPRGDRSPASTR